MRFLYLLTLFISVSSFAQLAQVSTSKPLVEDSPTTTAAPAAAAGVGAGAAATTSTDSICPPAAKCPKCEECESRGHTEKYRADSTGTVMVGYQLINTWVVGKFSGSYTHNIGKHWGLEFEYATSEHPTKVLGVELGTMREDRYTLFAKYFVGNSFHFSFGPYMYDLNFDTNNKFSDSLGNRIDEDWELEGYGAAFAFGNRWQTKWGLTYGADWVRMNMPFLDGKIKRLKTDLDNNGESDEKRTYALFRRVPAFTFFAVSIGYTF